jgi:glycosyltransferase involved in cell wall biosynthesis
MPRHLTARPNDGQVKAGVIALVPDQWDGIVMPRHQILSRLGNHMPVVWIEPPAGWRDYWLPGGSRFLRRRDWRSPQRGFTVLESGAMWPAFYHPDWLRRLTLAARLRTARRALTKVGVNRVVLYLWRYEFAEALDCCDHDLSIYHIDDEYSFSDTEQPLAANERGLIRRVDQVLVHSTALMRKKGALNPQTAVIPNGVDFGAFSLPSAEPADLIRVPHPRIGYVGVIKRQLDLELLVRLACARPDWSFVMVGPVGEIQGEEHALRTLRACANVHFMGYRPVASLPAYMQHLDACLMCYRVNDYTQYIYPLKLHEYLASGRPIVASPITTVLEHADVVTIARDDEEWLAGIARSLSWSACSPKEIERRRARASQFDWNALARKVATLIGDRLGSAAPGTPQSDSATC